MKVLNGGKNVFAKVIYIRIIIKNTLCIEMFAKLFRAIYMYMAVVSCFAADSYMHTGYSHRPK